MTYIEPLSGVLLAMALMGLFRSGDGRRSRLLVAGIVGLLLLSWEPAAWLFARPLEWRYPLRPFSPKTSADAIVVFSANVKTPSAEHPYPIPDRETFERCSYASWLYRTWKPVPVLACGGRFADGREPFSVSMKRLLVGSGVPADLVWTEETSTNTYENARNAAEILRRQGIHKVVLVVDVQSMLRAELCLRKQGIEVVAAPSRFSELKFPHDLIPGWSGVQLNEITLHEVVALVWYQIQGRI